MEIDFKEAVDYNTETGVMDINDSILFFKYPDDVSDKIKGVSYQLVMLESLFSSGRFTQNIDAVINTFPDPDPVAEGDSATDTSGPTESGNATSGNTGLTDNPDTDPAGGNQTNGNPDTPNPSDTQQSADDDAGGP